jgi:hypothetical protein
MNSTTFVLFGKYCSIVDQLGSKDLSRDFQLNCVISYFFTYIYYFMHGSKDWYDEKSEKILTFRVHLNKAPDPTANYLTLTYLESDECARPPTASTARTCCRLPPSPCALSRVRRLLLKLLVLLLRASRLNTEVEETGERRGEKREERWTVSLQPT